MTAKTPMSGSPEKRRDCIAQLPLRSTSGGCRRDNSTRKRVSLGDDDEIENFNLTFPYSLTLENFFHRHRFDVKRLATMHRSDGIFKLRNLFRTLHSGFLSSACPTRVRSWRHPVLRKRRHEVLEKS